MNNNVSKPLEINRITLANGLRVVHAAMPQTAMVALTVAYDAGARDEHPDHTGLAHLVEHCMFGSSENVADYSGTLAAAGAIDNAWTSNDFTIYYSMAPAHNAETLFYAESDRMLHPLFEREVVDVQRNVVTEEFKQQCLSRPYGDVMHTLRPMLYGAHPYSWPVIGKSIEQVQGLTQSMLIDWYTNLYTPSSAVVAITGNITRERAFELARKWFEPIPGRPRTVRELPPIPPLGADTEAVIEREVPATMVMRAWLMDEYGTRRYFAADALTDILASGQSSRFYRNLMIADQGRTFAQADASVTGSEHPGLLMLSARTATQQVDPRQAADIMTRQMRQVAEEGVTERELQRLKNRQISSFEMARMSAVGFGQLLALAEMHGQNPDFELQSYLALTPDDVTNEARTLLNNHSATLICQPKHP